MVENIACMENIVWVISCPMVCFETLINQARAHSSLAVPECESPRHWGWLKGLWYESQPTCLWWIDKRRMTLQTKQTMRDPYISACSTILSPVVEEESGKGRWGKEKGNRKKIRAWIRQDTLKNISKAEKSGSHREICSALSYLLNRSAASFPHLSFCYWWQHERIRLFKHVSLPHY